jgi:hypothetical protein
MYLLLEHIKDIKCKKPAFGIWTNSSTWVDIIMFWCDKLLD